LLFEQGQGGDESQSAGLLRSNRRKIDDAFGPRSVERRSGGRDDRA
jgi:hypothetical protein